MKVTTRRWKEYGTPPLWDVLIDGRVIGDPSRGYSSGRVLKMGNRFMPIIDGRSFALATFESLAACAAFVARYSVKEVK